MQKALGASERLDQIHLIDVENNTPRIEYQNNINDIDNTLSFCNVSFSYKENKSILKSLNFQVKIGQVTAFIGPSGAGKTTLFSLIECFYKPTEGNISYKGKSIYDISLFEWRNKIAYVSLDSPVMSGTINSNLIYRLNLNFRNSGLTGMLNMQI
ncbi:ATP-binding cassette domain-containing protein [Sporosarcina limicola]|uniref:ABC-type multidrug transport system fused ATPase/permease subunit n=1 Tax=Sporosarcina limicola TaxID=34101 RepID=A0A927RF53_9BACL|nr:ATP-binding cassette domain-containing protein [Sporosarcina limicola]MBE1556950.1 ABC-type multidrug transport system fused ATPase/permease subunit [Sporosarcina limicola]